MKMKGFFNVWAIIAIAGVFLVALGLAGYVFNDNPFVSQMPYLGENVQWMSDMFPVLLFVGVLLLVWGMTMSPLIGLATAIILYVILMFSGVIG